MRSARMLAVLLLVVFAVALGGWYFTNSSIHTWYPQLHRPAWTPPNWVFAPVWTVLYLLMALAMWLVWREEGSAAVTAPQSLWVAQLVLNLGWLIIFFALRQPGLALAEIILLWSAVLATTFIFFRITRPAGLLMAPYLLWLTFGMALNFSIWYMN